MTETHDNNTGRTLVRHCDVAVIGGSAAGMAAALQLTRQRRSVIVVDDGTPQNAPAEHMHGYLGREGTSPAEMRAIGREEVRSFGGEILAGRVVEVRRKDDGFHLDLTGGHTLVARRVVAATGMADALPDIPGLAERWGRQVIHCPFCHGFEVRDQRVVHIVTSPIGLHPASLMRHLTDQLTIVVHDATGIDQSTADALATSGVTVLTARVRRVADGSDAPLSVELDDGRSLPADAVLTGTTFHPRTEAFRGLDVAMAPHPSGLGEIVAADPTGRTSVDGFFAAGNLTGAGHQVIAAAAHGAFVGAQVAFSLAAEDIAAHARPSGWQQEWDARYAGAERMWSANPNGTMIAETGGLRAGRALDVGAGEGADALWLAERGWQVTATDIAGNALARIHAEAQRRGLDVRTLRCDANDVAPYGGETYDLVSLQYGSFHRTPDRRGLRNLLAAVAVGGTLLVVGHDLTTVRAHHDPAQQTLMYDPDAYVGVADVLAALEQSEAWRVDVHERRPRPAGAISSHHVTDVILRAVRISGDTP
jgi:thioredoxin reductase/SAM-dependent methyltransferase